MMRPVEPSHGPAVRHRGWEWPAVVALAVAALYLGLIWRQDGGIGPEAVVVFALIATSGLLGVMATRTTDPDRALVLRSAAAGALFSMGFLGIFSIGLPLLIAAIGFVVAAVRSGRAATRKARSRAFVWAAVAAAVPWVVLFA